MPRYKIEIETETVLDYGDLNDLEEFVVGWFPDDDPTEARASYN